MELPYKTEVCVADGRKLLLLVNDGDDKFPSLTVVRAEAQENPKDREQSTDAPGRSFDRVAPGRSAYEETDFHQLEETRFAAEVAEILRRRALSQKFDKLIVVAPPKTLGEIRQHYHKEVQQRLIGEIAKEATNIPPDGIATLIVNS